MKKRPYLEENLDRKPKEGTELRKLYDYFIDNALKWIKISDVGLSKSMNGRQRIILDLEDYYGFRIERKGKRYRVREYMLVAIYNKDLLGDALTNSDTDDV